MSRARRRWPRWLAGGVLALVLVVLGGAWLFASAMVSSANRPVHIPAEFHATTVSIPGDGHAIAGSWRDLGPDTPVVLLLHGMGGNRASTLPRARLLVDAGFSVLLIDLQAHGETPGELITLGWRESADVRAALGWLGTQAAGRRVGVLGVSLGGASFLIGERPAPVDALVLEAVHPRLRRAIENRVGRWFAPLLLVQIEPRLHAKVEQLDPIRNIARVGAPVLVVGGVLDANTTGEETRALFAAAHEPKELWLVAGAAHEDFSRADAAGYREHVIGFLRRTLAPQEGFR